MSQTVVRLRQLGLHGPVTAGRRLAGSEVDLPEDYRSGPDLVFDRWFRDSPHTKAHPSVVVWARQLFARGHKEVKTCERRIG
jgi:hypothetical protein